MEWIYKIKWLNFSVYAYLFVRCSDIAVIANPIYFDEICQLSLLFSIIKLMCALYIIIKAKEE